MARAISARPLADAGTVLWSAGSLRLGAELGSQNNRFSDQNEAVVASVNGAGATLEKNDDNGVQVNFGNGDFLLQTERPRDTILLTFKPPVRAAVAQVAAFSLDNTNPVSFKAVAQAKLSDGSVTAVKRSDATTTGARDGSAVCLGFECSAADAAIQSLAFSVEALGPAQALRSFGVNQVTYAEQQAAPLSVPTTAKAKTRGARG